MKNVLVRLMISAIALMPLCGCEDIAYRGSFILTAWAPLGSSNNFRVNGPDAATGRFKDRWEAKQTGLLEMDLPDVSGGKVNTAWLYCELWGGHPGLTNKRFTVNDCGAYPLPEVGTADDHCTYSYPQIEIDPAELRAGLNRIQFACDTGTAFWAHYLLRQVAVKYALSDSHGLIDAAGLTGFKADIAATASSVDADTEKVHLAIDVDEKFRPLVKSVLFQAHYRGYDENGDAKFHDWHGYTKDRQPAAFAAVTGDGVLEADWDISMLPDQSGPVLVRAIISFTASETLSYMTAPVSFTMPARTDSVQYYGVSGMAKPFWSRAGREKQAVIELPDDCADIKRAMLHFAAWDGGTGGREDHFTINGHKVSVVTEGLHDVIYTQAELDAAVLVPGENCIRLVSDTEHHGIEGLLPGPAIIIRSGER